MTDDDPNKAFRDELRAAEWDMLRRVLGDEGYDTREGGQATPEAAPYVPLLERLDALRAWLRTERETTEALSLQSALDAHLATLDDACEALQATPPRERRAWVEQRWMQLKGCWQVLIHRGDQQSLWEEYETLAQVVVGRAGAVSYLKARGEM